MSVGLSAAYDVLTAEGARRGAARLVLLLDGRGRLRRGRRGDLAEDTATRVAAELRSEGIRIAALGYGADGGSLTLSLIPTLTLSLVPNR